VQMIAYSNSSVYPENKINIDWLFYDGHNYGQLMAVNHTIMCFDDICDNDNAPFIVSFSPSEGSSDVAVDDCFVVGFSENIQLGHGLIEIHEGSPDGNIVESIDVAAGQQVWVYENLLTIEPSLRLAGNNYYYITFDEGVVSDFSGNIFSGSNEYYFKTGEYVQSYVLEGTVSFWHTSDTIEGVEVTLDSGAFSAETANDENGGFAFNDVTEGEYDVSAAKMPDESVSGSVGFSDALAALKIAVGRNPNSDDIEVQSFQYLAADVNHDGKVTPGDSLDILKMVVGSASNAEWVFVSSSVADDAMDRDSVDWNNQLSGLQVTGDTEIDLVGVITGDVDGSWSAS